MIGKFNIGSLVKNAKKIQEVMQKAQDDWPKFALQVNQVLV